MAQLPDSEVNNNKNNNSLMDEMKVNNPIIDEFCDNDSLQNHVDSHEYDNVINDDNNNNNNNNNNSTNANIHHTIIQNRERGPEPPLTVQTLQHFDNENPPQSMLAGTNLIQQHSGGSSQPIMSHIMDSFAHTNGGVTAVPEPLINPLIEMGFTKEKAIYALQQSANVMGTMSVEYALSWLFENPGFVPPDTSNITNTIGNMLGNEYYQLPQSNTNNNIPPQNNNNNNSNIIPPNNSPDHHANNGIHSNDNNTQNANDEFHLYKLIENITDANNNTTKSKSNRIYTHNNTIGSAATADNDNDIDEEKNDKVNPMPSDNNNNNKTIESKNDYESHDIPTGIYHQANTSTVASEMSALSALSTAAVATLQSQSHSPHIHSINTNNNMKEKMNTNANTNLNINSTKEQISQLYQQQNIIDNMNKSTISSDMLQHMDLKMVIIVRKDLKMSSGKVAAQCCHGCLGVVMDIINNQYQANNIGNNNNNNAGNDGLYDLRLILRLWRQNGGKKIVLQCANEKMLLELKDSAMINNLPHYLVCDAGHTQIKAGSKTVLAIGPYPSIDIDQITKELKLY